MARGGVFQEIKLVFKTLGKKKTLRSYLVVDFNLIYLSRAKTGGKNLLVYEKKSKMSFPNFDI